jgi:hypothetical protein
MPDYTGQAMGMVFEMEDKMKPSVDVLSKVWKEFGKLFDKTKKNVHKGFKVLTEGVNNFGKGTKEVNKDLKDIKRTEALEGLVQGFQSLQNARIDGISDDLESFTKNTADMRKLLGWTRDEMLSFRQEVRMASKDVGHGVLDMNLFSEALEGAAEAGIKDRDTMIEIGKSAALLSEYAGGAAESVTKTMWKLRDSIGFSSKAVDNLMVNMAELRKEQYGINVNFENLLETVQETSGMLEAGFRGFDDSAKRNVLDNLVSVQAAFESAFGEDAAGMTKDLMDQVSKGEGAFVTLLGGVDEAKRILAEGDPTKILQAMEQRISGIDSTLGLAKMAEGMGMTMENVVKLKDKMGDLVSVGDTAYQVMQDNSRSMDDFGKSAKDSLGWSERAFRSVKNWVSTQPLVAGVTDAVEGMGPALMAANSGWMLIKDMGAGKILKSITGGTWKLVSGLATVGAKAVWTAGVFTVQMLPALVGMAASATAAGVSFMAGLVPAFAAATTSTIAFTVALLANPITWVVVGIMALIAAIVLLVKHWDTVTDAVGKFFETMFGYVKQAAGWVYDTMIQPMVGAFEYLYDKISSIFGGIGDVLSSIIGGIGGAISGTVDWISSAFDSILGVIMTPINAIKGFINKWILDPLNKVLGWELPWPISESIGSLIGIGELPMLAAGGIVTGPTVAGIGEAGTEVIFPLSELERFMTNPPPNVYVENKFDEVVQEIRDLKNAILSLVSPRGGAGLRNPAAKKVVGWGGGA